MCSSGWCRWKQLSSMLGRKDYERNRASFSWDPCRLWLSWQASIYSGHISQCGDTMSQTRRPSFTCMSGVQTILSLYRYCEAILFHYSLTDVCPRSTSTRDDFWKTEIASGKTVDLSQSISKGETMRIGLNKLISNIFTMSLYYPCLPNFSIVESNASKSSHSS